MNRIIFCIKESLRSLLQGKMVTLISIITISIALFVVVLPLVAVVNIDKWFEVKESSTSLSVYFSDTLSDESTKEIYDSLSGKFPDASIRFSTPQQEYEFFVLKMGNELLGEIEGNPFGAAMYFDSLKTTPTDSVLEMCKAYPGVDDVVYQNEWLKKLSLLRTRAVRVLVLMAIIVSFLVSFTITNTVRLTVYARKELIKNMQYIGASDWYIKAPFLLEGIFQGLLGSVLSWVGVTSISSFFDQYLLWMDSSLLLFVMLVFGTLIGFLGSLNAVRKFFN